MKLIVFTVKTDMFVGAININIEVFKAFTKALHWMFDTVPNLVPPIRPVAVLDLCLATSQNDISGCPPQLLVQ